MKHVPISSKCLNADTADNMHNQTPLLVDSCDASNSLPTASVLSSTLNLSNSILGAAVLTIPWAVAQVGWVLSIALLIFCCCLSVFTFQLQTSAGIIYNNSTNSFASSYYSLSHTSVPKYSHSLSRFADFVVAIACFGPITAYLLIIGDCMPPVFDALSKEISSEFLQSAVTNRRFWISVFMLFLIVPPSCFRKLNALAYSSFLAMICFFGILFIMVFYLDDSAVNICRDSDCGIQEIVTDSRVGLFKALPMYFFAFGCHPMAFGVTNELVNGTFGRMNLVLCFSFGITAVLYMSYGLLGYFTFGSTVNSNVLLNYPNDDALVSVVRVGLAIAVAFSYPVILAPLRHCLASLIFQKNATELSNARFIGITVFVLIFTFSIAMVVDELGLVVGFIGSTTAPIYILVLPGMYYYFMHKQASLQLKSSRHWLCNKINLCGSVTSVLLGILIIPFCVMVLFVN